MPHLASVALDVARAPALSALSYLANTAMLLVSARAATASVAPAPEPEQITLTPKFAVRPLTALSSAELAEATGMLAHAFDDGPLFSLAFPHAETRRKILPILFATVLKDAVRYGRVEVAHNGKIVGMIVWYPPGRYPMSGMRILRQLPDYLRMLAASPLGLMKLSRAQSVLNRCRPAEPHCHGYFLGGRQGEHVGSVLIKRLFNAADENGWPVYLETQAPRSTKLYARLGFKMREDGIETLPGGPPTWTMWREPRTIQATTADGALVPAA